MFTVFQQNQAELDPSRVQQQSRTEAARNRARSEEQAVKQQIAQLSTNNQEQQLAIKELKDALAKRIQVRQPRSPCPARPDQTTSLNELQDIQALQQQMMTQPTAVCFLLLGMYCCWLCAY